MSPLPEEDQVALFTYLTKFRNEIDGALRSGDASSIALWDAHIRMATIGLVQLPCFEGPVFCGASLKPGAVAGYVPGTIVREPGFVVGTTDPASRLPGNVRYVIHSENGREVASVSDDPAAQLVMFFAGTQFKVLAVDHDTAASTWAVFLREVPDPRVMGRRQLS